MIKTEVYVSTELEGNYVFRDEQSAYESVNDNYFKHDAWMCEHCGVEEVFLDEEDAEKHDMTCIMNPDNRSIVTSKFIGVELYPPYPRYRHDERDRYGKDAVGTYNKAFDTRTGEYLNNKDLKRDMGKAWEPMELDSIGQPKTKVILTDAYKKYKRLLDEAVEEAEQKKELAKKDRRLNRYMNEE